MSKTQTKSAINTIDTNLNSTNLGTVGTIINRHRDALLLTLLPANDLFVDQENVDKIHKILDNLNAKSLDLDSRDQTLDDEDASLFAQLAGANPARTIQINQKRADIVIEKGRIVTLRGNMASRKAEYQALSNAVDAFDIARPLPDMKTNIYNLNADIMKPGSMATGYNFYNEDGSPLNLANNRIDVRLDDGTTQNVRINGLAINAAGQIDVSGITFTNRAGAAYVPPQGYQFTVYPGGYVNLGGKNLVHNKPLNVIRPNPGALNTQALRMGAIDNYNNAGTGNVISHAMTASYNNTGAKLQREAFFRAVAHKDGPKFDKLSAKQKEDLYQRVRRLPQRSAGIVNIDNYNAGANGFVNRFSGDKHPSNNPKDTANSRTYSDYIHNNLEDQITAYFNYRFDNAFIDNADVNTYLKTEVTNYLAEIERNKIDNNSHTVADASLTPVQMRSRKRFGLFGRNDINYMRFFGGAKIDMGSQTVNIGTNTHPEDLNNEEPVTYTMQLEVSKKNQMSAIIKIGKQKERKISAGNPMALMQHILRMPDIPYGKVRMHVAYNVAKGMILHAKKQDISLTYRNPANNHNMVINLDDENKNIILEDQDDLTNYGGNNRRISTTLFDHSLFESTNTFDPAAPNDNRSLRIGIDRLTTHFNCAMNNLHRNYTQATERRRLGLRRSATRTEFPRSYRTSPIKKLMNCRTTTNFDFTTTIEAGQEDTKKSVNVEFKKNMITISMEGLKKPISGRDLGKLLNHRVGGIRIFDGLERDIIGGIYKNMVEKLRANTKIARSNLGAVDPITKRIYILDEDGQFGYISAEAAKKFRLPRTPGVNTIANAAITGGLVGGGLAAGGVAALTSGLSRAAAGTAGSRGIAGLTGANLINDIMNIGNSGYGIIDHPPAGRLICDEAETREILKNPFLMGKFMKAANLRLGKF